MLGQRLSLTRECVRAGVKILSAERASLSEMSTSHTFADFGRRREGCEILPAASGSSLLGSTSSRSGDAWTAFDDAEQPPDADEPASDEDDGGASLGGIGRLGRRLSSAVRGWQRRLAERKSRPPPPRSPRAATVDGATVLTEERVTFPVDQFYLGLRYLRAEAPSTGVPKVEALPICCAGCGAALSDTDQVLCTERRWGFQQRTPQPSMYVNSLRPGSCKSLGVSRMLLGQGAFDMSDAACTECGKMVGYVFHGAADEHQNGNHVGRAGLVRHSIGTSSVQQPLRDVVKANVGPRCSLASPSAMRWGELNAKTPRPPDDAAAGAGSGLSRRRRVTRCRLREAALLS